MSSTSPLIDAPQVLQDMRTNIPDSVIDRAHCIAVIPKLTKAAFLVGGEHGRGVMSCRTASGWSAPVFLELTKGSFGFQAGVSEVSLVLLVMNEGGAQKLLSNEVNLGADASVAAGPVGRQGAVATDASMSAEILSYSHAKGLFAGIDLSGGALRPDRDANRKLYGESADPRTILASRPPAEAQAFIAALPGPSRTTASTATTQPARPTGTTGMSPAPAHRRAPRMPQTASPLALYELASGLAFAGAIGVRYLRRRLT
jgi:lipid-binding SYLF domain-containing protein